MSMIINHNLMANSTQRLLNRHYGNLEGSIERLSSGLRINNAADDAAGLAISEIMRADIASMKQGIRNANDAISLIQTADGAMQIIDEALIRMKELAEQAATGTYDSVQRGIIDSEYQQMASEITRIAMATNFNNVKLLDGTLSGEEVNLEGTGPDNLSSTGKMKIHFGSTNESAEDYYYIKIGNITASALGLGNFANPDLYGDGEVNGFSISTQGGASRALVAVENAIISKDLIRAHLGAMENRLESTVANLEIMSENLQASEARIRDADISIEMTEFTKNQILAQTAASMLGQANSIPQMASQLVG